MLEWPTNREITTRSMPMSIMSPIRDLRRSCGENLSTPPCFLRLLPILMIPVRVMPTRNMLLPLLVGLNKGPLIFDPYGDPIVECHQDIPGQEVRAPLLFLSADLGRLCRFVVVLIFQFGEFLSAHPEHTGDDDYNSIPSSSLSFVLTAHTHTGFPFSQRYTAPGWYLAHVNTRNRNGKAIILIAPLPHCQEIFRMLRTCSGHG